MKELLFIICLLVVTYSQAAEIKFGIHEIQDGSEVMVKASTGEVFWVDPHNEELMDTLTQAQTLNLKVQVQFESANNIIQSVSMLSQKSLPVFDKQDRDEKVLSDVEPPYSPTIFTSLAALQDAHNSMDNRTHEDSQCYNRAHGWAYDLWRTRGINSMKIFLFFTDRYIREYRHKWWFHVSPMTYLREAYGVNEYVIDRSFSEAPVYTQVWTNIFIKNFATCRSVNHYDDYRKDDPNEYCYLMRSTMYYRGTVGLRKRDRNHKYRTKWSTKELREARRQAFIYADEYDI